MSFQADARPGEPLRLHLARESLCKRSPTRCRIQHSIRRRLPPRTLLRSAHRLRGLFELTRARPLDIQLTQLAMEIPPPISGGKRRRQVAPQLMGGTPLAFGAQVVPDLPQVAAIFDALQGSDEMQPPEHHRLPAFQA
jgi:hypothetical protein